MNTQFDHLEKKFNDMFNQLTRRAAKGGISDFFDPLDRSTVFGPGYSEPDTSVDYLVKKKDQNTVELHIDTFRFDKDKARVKKVGERLYITLIGEKPETGQKEITFNLKKYVKGTHFEIKAQKGDGRIIITCSGYNPDTETIKIE